MSNPKISVVMPIYNVEKYLEDALNSLLNQTFIDNMEILMIDDGSTDNSRYIIEKYALDYDNFHAIHKINEGAPLARNLGISLAKGDYIQFFDADDYLAPDWFEKLFKLATTNDSDITTAPIVRWRRYNIFEGFFYKNSFKKFNQDIASTKFKDNPELIWDLFITNKLYKQEFLKEYKLKFIEENRFYCDDSPFSLKAYFLANNVSICTDTFYYWRYRENKDSITQKITQIKNFKDRLLAIKMYNEIINEEEVNDELIESIYLKILNYDLYAHFSKFHMYDKEYHLELIDEANEILSIIPEKCKKELNSEKKIIYKMVEDKSIDELCNFTALNNDLKKNPELPKSFNQRYMEYVDFEKDAINEELFVKKEDVYIEDNNLLIEFSEKINYLTSGYPHETLAILIDIKNNEYPLEVIDNKIIIPIDLIYDKSHMKIRMEYIADNFEKETYLINSKREIFEFDGFDIEIGIETKRVFCIDIRLTNDLCIKLENISFKNNIFEFKGISDEKITNAYIQNVVTFDKINYPVMSNKQESNYEISFLIPYEDILSYPVRKWELKIGNRFKTIRLNKKFEFYMEYNMVYMINARHKILISDDIYNSLEKLNDYSEKIMKLNKSKKDLKQNNIQLKKRNSELKDNNKKLKEKNKVLKKEKSKLNKKNKELENKIFNPKPIKRYINTKILKK